MWPDNGFARPVSSFEAPVGLVLVDPCDNPDVSVAFRSEWLPYIIGALKQLVLQTTWATDDANALWLVQERAMNLLQCFMQATAPVVCLPPVQEMEIDLAICEQLRFQDGKLQALCCGEWTDIAGQPPQGIGGPGQPGGGSEQPPADGGSACYNGQMPATGGWLVPTIVSAGDTVELTEAQGAGQDGTLSPWYCPNGQTFFAGACIGAGGVSGSDPLPSVNHMSLLFLIDGVYYDAMNGPVTVPGGVSNVPVEVVLNDSVLSDNSGSYAFKVCVTNNQAGSWSSLFDLKLNNYADILSIPYGTWVAGVGIQGVANGAHQLHTVVIDITVDPTTIEQMGFTYNAGGGSGGSQSTQLSTDTGLYGTPGVPGSGTGLNYGQVIERTGVLTIELAIGSGDTDAQVTVTAWSISGIGPKPAGWP